MMKRDVIIIGAGAAGLSAALWCAELGLEAILLEREEEIGGQLSWIHNSIENHLGAHAADGREMREQFAAQIENSRFEMRTGTEVARVGLRAKRVLLQDGEEIQSRALIIATGLRRRRLNVEGEREFAGRGIIESGRGEQGSLTSRDICIIGGGDAAAENALLLAEACPRVALIVRGPRLRARRAFAEAVTANPRITVFYNSTVRRINGEKEVEAIEVVRAGDDETTQDLIIEARGVLVRIGYEPNSELFRDQLNLNARGYITITSEAETSVPNVFAVGDISNPRAPTVSGATGAGATAAKVIAARLASA